MDLASNVSGVLGGCGIVTTSSASPPSSSSPFRCDACAMRYSKKSNFKRHLATSKHRKAVAATASSTVLPPSSFPQADSAAAANTTSSYPCAFCGKEFLHRSSMYRHRQHCRAADTAATAATLQHNVTPHPAVLQTHDLLQHLMQENRELKQMIVDVCRQVQNIPAVSNNTTTNTMTAHFHQNIHCQQHKTFNLHVFLNETCKDAMNISEFVNSLKLQLSDLESVGQVGFTNGISNIIVRHLNALDVERRPVHCTDKKREVLYIKDENRWEKEDEQKRKLRRAIQQIADKNLQLVTQYRAKHPDCSQEQSPASDHYQRLVVEALGGSDEEHSKIIRKIAKEVSLDKSALTVL